jgi:hypothetical protein
LRIKEQETCLTLQEHDDDDDDDDDDDLHFSTTGIRAIKSKIMRWVGYIARMGERRDAYWILVLKTEGKRQLVKPRHGRENYIRMDLKE